MKYFIFILCLFLAACSNQKQKDNNYFATLGLKNDSLETKVQIQANTSSKISLPSGRKIEASANSFLYEDGTIVTEPVEIQIKEYTTYSDILSNALQTISPDGVLETDGMYYLEAKTSSGKALKINPNSPLYLTGNLTNNKPDFNLYKGIDSDGGIVWNNPIPSFKLGAIHFAALFDHYKTNVIVNYVKEPLHIFWYESILDFMIDSMDLVQYQNSMVASPAFVERFVQLNYTYGALSPNDDALRSFDYKKKERYEDFKLHLQYIGRFLKSIPLAHYTLPQIDSILLDKMTLDSIQTIVHYKKKGYYDKNTANNIHLHIQNYRNHFCKKDAYIMFDFTQKIPVDTITLLDISTNGYDPDKEVPKKGMPSKLLISIENKNLFLQSLSYAYGDKYSTTAFKYPLFQLGWYNIDKLLLEGLKEVEISVTINTDNPNTTIALLLKERKIVLYENITDGKCSIKKKLPNEKAIVLASFSTNDKTYFAQKEILIGSDSKVQLDLKLSTKEAIQKVLEDIEQ